MVGCGYAVLFVCVLGGWLSGWLYVYVVIVIDSCKVVYLAWGLSSYARSEDFGFLLFEGMDVWFDYRVWGVWKRVWMRRLSFLIVVWLV